MFPRGGGLHWQVHNAFSTQWNFNITKSSFLFPPVLFQATSGTRTLNQSLSEVIINQSNSPFRSYQRFCHMNEAKGSFCIALTLKPLLHVALNKRKCACRLNSNKNHSLITFDIQLKTALFKGEELAHFGWENSLPSMCFRIWRHLSFEFVGSLNMIYFDRLWFDLIHIPNWWNALCLVQKRNFKPVEIYIIMNLFEFFSKSL